MKKKRPYNTLTKTHKIRIYPNQETQKILQRYADYSIYIWNKMLDARDEQYKVYKELKSQNIFSQQELNKNYYPSVAWLRKTPKEDWELKFNARCKEIQIEKLDQAWKNYFNPKMPNHKRPKKKNQLENYDMFSVSFRNARVKDKYLILPNSKNPQENKLKKIRMAEKLRLTGDITQDVTVSCRYGKWYVSITVEDTTFKKKETDRDKKTAVDLNIKKFDYKKDEKTYSQFVLLEDNLLKAYDDIKVYSKILSKKRSKNKDYKNSKSYKKMNKQLNDAYLRAYNIQQNYINQTVAFLFKNYNYIILEDLNVNSMKMNKSLCKSLHKAMFGRFKIRMEQKSTEFDSSLVFADRWYPSTQRCSECGFIKTGDEKLGLNGDNHGNPHNKYVCYNCGIILDRDENAVENLLQYSEELMKEIRKFSKQ